MLLPEVLEAAETEPVAKAVAAALGAGKRGQLRQVWREAHATRDDDARGMVRLGRRWCRIVRWTVDEADAEGRLRGILDAVRSNRVEDDFSERWSFAREDFERKLYHKRSKVKVRFVELTDTIPVQGPETEVEDGQSGRGSPARSLGRCSGRAPVRG